MYIICAGEVATKTLTILRAINIPPSSITPRMPSGSRKSRVAKRKRQEGRDQGHAAFATRPPSSNSSDFCVSDDSTDESATDKDSSKDSSDDKGGDNETGMSVVALQRLYAASLPPHLQLDEDTLKKRRKMRDRPPVYTGDSRTTAWRRSVAQKKAAQGCMTLDGFIQRKVSEPKILRSEAKHLIVNRRGGSTTPHRLRKIKRPKKWRSLMAAKAITPYQCQVIH